MDIAQITVTRLGGEPFKDPVVGPTRTMVLGRWLRGQRIPGFQFWATVADDKVKVLRGPDDAGIDPDVVDFYWHKNGTPKRIGG